MTKGIIYYTDNNIDPLILEASRMTIFDSELPIWSSSLKPIKFGQNVVLDGQRGYPMMVNQIINCLERATTDFVFFCEHDVLYHPKYFDYEPIRYDAFLYNTNNWRWDYPHDRLIQYDGLTSLSQLFVNRELALTHYKRRQKAIQELPEGSYESNEPAKFRTWGYEPGRKPTSNGGFSDERSGLFSSKYPNIDIRHTKTFSSPKTRLEHFKHAPVNWVETKLNDIPGWSLRELFNLWS